MTDMTPAKRLAKANKFLDDVDRLLKTFPLKANAVNLFIRNYNSICDGGILTTFDEFDSKEPHLTDDFTEILQQIQTNLSSYVDCNRDMISNTEHPNEPNTTSTQEADRSTSNNNEKFKTKFYASIITAIITALLTSFIIYNNHTKLDTIPKKKEQIELENSLDEAIDLLKRADQINIKDSNSAFAASAIIDDFNIFAKKAGIETIQPFNRYQDRDLNDNHLKDAGIAKFNSVKNRLGMYIAKSKKKIEKYKWHNSVSLIWKSLIESICAKISAFIHVLADIFAIIMGIKSFKKNTEIKSN